MYNSRMTRRLLAALLLAVLPAACSQRDVRNDLKIVDVRTGWYDMGVVRDGQYKGQNKIVPSISFKLKNVSQEPISGVQMNAVFRDINNPAVAGEHYVSAVSSNAPLAAGATTNEFVLRANLGYTGTESRAQMLKNSHFVDRRVTILLKHGRTNWTPVAEIPIERQLLTE
jgi:hypothetical protein